MTHWFMAEMLQDERIRAVVNTHDDQSEELPLPDLAEFILTRRRRANLTQQGLAQKIKLSPSAIRKLEQRDPAYRPSPSVLNSLVEAFFLTQHEREHLDVLAGYVPATAVAWRLPEDAERSILEVIDPRTPAAWLEDWRIVHANNRFRTLWPGLADAPSILDWWFTDERARKVTPNWEEEGLVIVGQLRVYAADNTNSGRARQLLDGLAGIPAFRKLWDTGTVHRARPGLRRVWSASEQREVAVNDVLVVAGSTSQWGRALYIGLPNETG